MGAGTESGALRAAQHFHLSRVEQVGGISGAADFEIIDRQAHRRVVLGLAVLFQVPDAAHLQEAASGGAAGPIDVGREAEQLLDVTSGPVGGRLAAEHRDAARLLHQRSAVEGRGDDDLLFDSLFGHRAGDRQRQEQGGAEHRERREK